MASIPVQDEVYVLDKGGTSPSCVMKRQQASQTTNHDVGILRQSCQFNIPSLSIPILPHCLMTIKVPAVLILTMMQ